VTTTRRPRGDDDDSGDDARDDHEDDDHEDDNHDDDNHDDDNHDDDNHDDDNHDDDNHDDDNQGQLGTCRTTRNLTQSELRIDERPARELRLIGGDGVGARR